jgi:hypothetical protein
MDERVPFEPDPLDNWGSYSWYYIASGRCKNCGHEADLDRRALSRVPAKTMLVYMRQRMRCRKCGTRGRAKLFVRKKPR